MPNPVVSFEIRGRNTIRLRAFYAEVFAWQIEALPGGTYAFIETAQHDHDDSGATQFTGADAHMNDGVVLGSAWGQPAWKYTNEDAWRSFEPGIGGGIGEDEAGVSVYIGVPDIEDALKRVASAGGRVLREPAEVAPGIIIASFVDPEGNRMELIRR